MALLVIKTRKEFLAAARGRKHAAAGLLLQMRPRHAGETPPEDAVRIGFTASKKVGNAVLRNRAKRRMRALAQEILPLEGRPGHDYVMVARAGETVSRNFDLLRGDLRAALARLHAPAKTRQTQDPARR